MGKKMRLLRKYPGAWTRTEMEQIGPDGLMPGIAARPLPVFSDANTVFVSKAGLNTNPGTQAQPKLTLSAAIFEADDLGKPYVNILDSGVYEEILDFLELCQQGQPPVVYAAQGCTPTIRRKTYSGIVSGIDPFIGKTIAGYTAVSCPPLYRSGIHYVCGKYDATGQYRLITINDETGELSDGLFDGVSSGKFLSIIDYKDNSNLAIITDGDNVIRLVSLVDGVVVRMLTIPGESVSAIGGVADDTRLYVSPVGDTDLCLLYYDKVNDFWGSFDISDIKEVYGPPVMNNQVLLDGTSAFWFASSSMRPNDTIIFRVTLATGTVAAHVVSGKFKVATLHKGQVFVITTDGVLHEISLLTSGGMTSSVNIFAKQYINTFTTNSFASNGKVLLYIQKSGTGGSTRASLRSFDGETEIQLSSHGFMAAANNIVGPMSIGEKRLVLDTWFIMTTALVSSSTIFNGCTIEPRNLGIGYHGDGPVQYCAITDATTACTSLMDHSIVDGAVTGVDTAGDGASISRNLILNCETGIKASGAVNCTIAKCKTGLRLTGSATVSNNILALNDLDIEADAPRAIGDNLFRTSSGVTVADSGTQVADLPLFVDPENGDFTLRDKARGYLYDSPGVSDDGDDHGAYAVNRSQAADATELDAILPWMPSQMQMTHNLVQMTAQDMINGGLAVQHAGCWRSWALSWMDDNGDLAESADWAAQLAIIGDVYAKAGDKSKLWFGLTKDDGTGWGIERTLMVRVGSGSAFAEKRILYINASVSGADYAKLAAIAREWVHRYISLEGRDPVRIASVEVTETGATITTESDVAQDAVGGSQRSIALLELWKVAVDPRQSLSLTRQYPWSGAGQTGAELVLREVPT